MLRGIERIGCYAPELVEVQALVDSLTHELDELAHLSMLERKKRHMASSSSSQGRSAEGYARKRVGRDLVFLSAVPELMEAAGPARLVGRSLLQQDLRPERVAVPTQSVLALPDEVECVRLVAARFQHVSMRLLFVGSRLHDNWFSHWHQDQGTAVVSTADLPPGLLSAFAAYEVVFHGLRLLSPGYSSALMTHDETRGCLFDFCGMRADLEIKLHTADICAECEAKLGRFGIDVGRVREACEVIRQATHR